MLDRRAARRSPRHRSPSTSARSTTEVAANCRHAACRHQQTGASASAMTLTSSRERFARECLHAPTRAAADALEREPFAVRTPARSQRRAIESAAILTALFRSTSRAIHRSVDAAHGYAASESQLAESHFYSHWTAALILKLPMPRAHGTPREHRRPGSRTTRPWNCRSHNTVGTGDPGARPASSTLSTRGLQSVICSVQRQLIVIGDALVRRKKPISTIATIAAEVQKTRGRRGQGLAAMSSFVHEPTR